MTNYSTATISSQAAAEIAAIEEIAAKRGLKLPEPNTETLTPTKIQPPLIKTPGQLKAYLIDQFGIRIPNVKVCEKHSTPWQAFHEAYFAQHGNSVWKASRGLGGKSFMLALLGLVEAATLKADVNILGGSGQQSQRVHEYQKEFWEKPPAPRMYLRGMPSAKLTRFIWGNKVIALMASQRSARGPHPQRLLLDEIDEMNLDILKASMGQTMDKETEDGMILSHTVYSSTKQYPDGPMNFIEEEALAKGWHIHEWCYKETSAPGGWLTQAMIEKKKNDMTAGMWETEVELQEPNPESRAITPSAVQWMFDTEMGEFDGNPNEYIEVEPPVPGATYAHGADWAKSKDWTIILTTRTDVYPMRLVAFERTARLNWPVMVKKFDDRIKRYGGPSANDATGVGSVVNDYMTTLRSEPVILVGKLRADVLTKYIAGIEHFEIKAPMIRWMFREHLFASREDVFSGGDGIHLPDTISAGSMVYRAALLGGTMPGDSDTQSYGRGEAMKQGTDFASMRRAGAAGTLDDDIAAWGTGGATTPPKGATNNGTKSNETDGHA